MIELLPEGKKPLLQILILIGYVLAGLFIFQFFSLALGVILSGMEMNDFVQSFTNPIAHPELKSLLLLTQFLSSLGGFILAPLLFIYHHEKRNIFLDFHSRDLDLKGAILVLCITFAFIVADSVIIEWNMGWTFPEPFHSWAKLREDTAAELTEYLTTMNSLPYFLVVFVTVGLLPAVGEELLFRGLIQKYLQAMTKNPHVAIWITAVLFSAFHIQFFGFVPRMLLGALFGYLFYYSGNLIYAMIGHFANNGLTVLMLYLFQSGVVDYDIENTESIPLHTAGIFAIIGIVLFILYKNQFKNRHLV